MLSRLVIHLIEPLTSNGRLFIVWVLFVAFFFWMTRLDDQLKAVGGGAGILDLQFAFTAEQGRQILQNWGAAGRDLARRGLVWDWVYPLVYALAFGASLLRLSGPEDRWRKILILLPLWTILFDYGENLLHWQVLRTYPILDGSQIRLASIWAVVKWLLVGVMIFMLSYKMVQRQFRLNRAVDAD